MNVNLKILKKKVSNIFTDARPDYLDYHTSIGDILSSDEKFTVDMLFAVLDTLIEEELKHDRKD